MLFDFYPWVSFITQIWLYLIVLMTGIYMCYKYRKSLLHIYIILLFYPGFFAFLGKEFTDVWRIITLGFTFWFCIERKVFSVWTNKDILLTILFTLLTLSFFLSFFHSGDRVTVVLSQYSRYIIAYCLWFIIRKEIIMSESRRVRLIHLLYDLILMQMIISIAKLILFEGAQIESLVGSLSHIGGAAGTTIPILGFMVLWFYRNGKFQLKDWIFVLGLMLIGFTTGKRAVWFIMPIVIFAFMIYVPRIKVNKTLWIAIIMAPFALYLGVRLTPTLNPEYQVWGSFDLEYAWNYAMEYQFGKEEENVVPIIDLKQGDIAMGRGGGTIALIEHFFDFDNLSVIDWLGVGFSTMYATNYKEFADSNIFVQLNHKGSATGLFQTYVTMGYLGVFTTILFFFYMLCQIKLRRLRWVVLGVVAWEYFMYTGFIFRTTAFMLLIVFFVHYSNFLVWQNKQNKLKLD
ncbi:hypothetical protein D0T49_03145 [Paludibacter sp. 221]|uniref:hypothetical protein n=1 Tax=Paludibacter sp. 221 TaxID=2302939 RepID=UPI0013CF964E|nr:hypothetical protein [Paludibacter sp. 221]NDV46036.1 hypothetical protein [Paludibacter sp. 221]